ncbi:terpenoid synthase [Thelephora ganbajun]|uniref:Terpenoid synthase n=1 Tax=Thelephora ganbajun TaxID=370292 RepID=A0ACB6ZI38_THEGA|nr:terpenoid synthase [Thelephora ganbajun]
MQQFALPDLHSTCPLKDATNPHHKSAAAESRAWINGFKVFSDEKRAEFIAGSNELLVSHAYPFAPYERFRVCCDFINTLFVVDEISDVQNGKDALSTGMIYLNVLKDPSWDDGSKLAQITREFRSRLYKFAKPNCQRRFYQTCADYVDAVGKEAEYRVQSKVLDLVSYTKLRRDNSAVYACFALFEYALDIDLPDEVVEHPTFKNLQDWGCDLVCWANDVYSYDVEQSKGLEGNNILTVLMEAKGFNLQEAADNAGVLFGDLMSCFIAERKKLPSWGPDLDRDVSRYVDAIGHWVVGNLCWSFETPRYFGSALEDVKRTRIVKLRPRKVKTKSDEIVLYERQTKNLSRSPFSVRSVRASISYLLICALFLVYFYHAPRFNLL